MAIRMYCVFFAFLFVHRVLWISRNHKFKVGRKVGFSRDNRLSNHIHGFTLLLEPCQR